MEVPASWARIVGWCRDHAPETAAAIRPPLPSFVPITEDQCGDDMFVDTRQGTRHGLEAGRPVGGWRPLVEDGRLRWAVAPR
jgi:cell wall assembly regulator SMI1